MRGTTNPIIIWIWSKVWRNYLEGSDTVHSVTGWRTARITTRTGCRRLIEPAPILTFLEKRRIKKRDKLEEK